MAQIIRLKIDVSKVLKDALYKGAKGTYLDATLFLEDADDQYGQCGRIDQDIGKERRASGEKAPILGNAKRAGQQQSRQQQPSRREPSITERMVQGDTDDDSQEIPF